VSKRREFGPWARLAVALLGVLAGLAALETAVRVRQRIKYGTTNTTVFQPVIDAASGLAIPEPGSSTGRIRIDSRGFRSPELEMPKPPGRIRLAFLGASTTFCAEVSDNQATWPHLVWRAVQQAHPELQFDYVNAAVPGYSTQESLRNLRARVARLQPDVIFIYHASNDLSVDSRALARAAGLFQGKPEESSLPARWSLAWYLIEKNLQLRSRQQEAHSGARRLESDPGELSRPFDERLRELVAEARAVAPVVVLGTFSHHARPEQSAAEQLRACNTSLYYMPYMSVSGLLAAFEEYNRVIRAVAQDTGVVLADVAGAIPGSDRYFHDSIHFTDAGAELMGRLMTKALTESHAFHALAARAAPPAGRHAAPLAAAERRGQVVAR
jgi:lysophospholipase L1-like esterase